MAKNAFQEAQDLFTRVYRSNIAPAGQRAQAFLGNVAQNVRQNPVVSQAVQRANAPITAYTGNLKISPQQASSNLRQNVQTLRRQPSNFLQGNYPVAYKAAEGFGEGLSFNLIDVPGAKSTSNKERAAYVGGQIGGMYANPLSKGLNPFTAADKLGTSVVSKLAPRLTGLSSKIASGVVGEGIQTAGYLGAGELARRAGLNKFDPITKENILPQAGNALLFGLLMRGAYSPFSNSASIKDAKNVLDKGDITEIENMYARSAKKWLGEKGVDLNQYKKDTLLVDRILQSKYGATVKELKIPLQDKIETLYKIAAEDRRAYFKRGSQGLQMGIAGDQKLDPLTQEARKSAEELVKAKKGIVEPGNSYADLHGVNPESTVTIYRGVKSSQNGKLTGGEWVTQDKELARLYSRNRARASGEDARIISQKVKAKDLIISKDTSPGVTDEFIYTPNAKSQLTDIYNQATKGQGADPERVRALKERELRENLDDAQNLMQASKDRVSALVEQIKGKGYKSDKEIPQALKKQLDAAGAEWELNASKWQKLADERITQLKSPTAVAMGSAGNQQVSKSALDEANQNFADFIGANPGQKERAFIQTVRNSPNTSPDVAKSINGFYDPLTNQETLAKVQKNVLERGVDTVKRDLFDRMDVGTSSAEDTTTALELMRRYQNEGNFEAAAEVVEKVSKSLTSSGQAIQAASLWSRLTPEGMVLYAQRELERAKLKQGTLDKGIQKILGKEFTGKLSPQAQETIYSLMKQAETLPAGPQKDAFVRQALTQISKEIPLGVNEVLDAFRYTNMLSNPITHLRNIYGNMVQTFVTRPATIATDGAIDFVKFAVQGNPSFEPLTRAGKYYAGTINSHSTAIEALKGVLKGESPIEQLDMRAVRNEKLPVALRAIPSFMEGMDKYFQTMVTSGEYQRQLSKGISPEQAKQSAEEVAKYTLFRGSGEKNSLILKQIDQVTDWILEGRKKVPGLSWFIPFVQTPMNFAKQWVEYSPLGFATAVGAKDKQAQIAKALIGSTALAVGANYALTNNATWAAPTDPKEKAAFYASGRKPFSVRVGDTWVPAIYFGPMAWAMMLPAATQYYHEKTKTAGTDSEIQKLINTMSSSVEFFSEQTFAQGLGNWTRLLQGDIDYSAATNLAFTAEQLLPFRGTLSYIARTLDPTYRKIPSGTFEQRFLDTIKKDIPYMSKELPAITEPNGEESRRSPYAPFIPFDVGSSNREYDSQINDIQQVNQMRSAYTQSQDTQKAQIDEIENKLKTLPREQIRQYLLDGVQKGLITEDVISELKGRAKASRQSLNVAEQKLLAQPTEVRAQFIEGQLSGKSSEEIRTILLNYAAKGILTDATVKEMIARKKSASQGS